MDKNVIAGICARSQSLHFNLHLYLDTQSLLGPQNLSSSLSGSVSMASMHGSVVSLWVLQVREVSFSDHDIMTTTDKEECWKHWTCSYRLYDEIEL